MFQVSVDLVLKKENILYDTQLDSQALSGDPYELSPLFAESLGRPDGAKDLESEGASGWSWM